MSTLLRRARELRRRPTDAEHLLWKHLRGRRLAGIKFRRQVVREGFLLDLYCPAAKLAVEIDGGQHAERGNRAHDTARTALLARRGIAVLRFWNDDVLARTEAVLLRIGSVAMTRMPLLPAFGGTPPAEREEMKSPSSPHEPEEMQSPPPRLRRDSSRGAGGDEEPSSAGLLPRSGRR